MRNFTEKEINEFLKQNDYDIRKTRRCTLD